MKFDELDTKMRHYEQAADIRAIPFTYLVARVDGCSFARLSNEVHGFEAPFDARFRDIMVATTEHLMQCGFHTLFGFTQSDEISILIDRDDMTFDRRLSTMNSVLAGKASAKFSLLLGDLGAFDCRISQLATKTLVVDYFRWRSEMAHRNALNVHCHWALRRKGQSERQALDVVSRASTAEKGELLLREAGIDFDELPAWQKRGVGVYWEQGREAAMAKTEASPESKDRRLSVDLELPMRDGFSEFVEDLVVHGLVVA